MHIPDGYLSPTTCAVLTAAMVPLWAVASKRAQRVVKSRYAPLMAVGAAYSFLVMMFNLPIPDGTTAHGVGAVLIAILLGRWAAVISVSVALLIQALFFGDGGLLAFGANAFNMAVVMPFVGYAVYRVLTTNTSLTSSRRALSAGIAAYVGINVGALVAAVEFGLQPTLFQTADGTPLYAPFDLSQTIPVMAFAHLTIAGFVEFALTVGVIAYLQRANLPLLRLNHPDVVDTDAELERRPVSLAVGPLRPRRDGAAVAPRPARSGRGVRRGRAGGPRPRQVRPRRRAAGPQRLHRLVEPHLAATDTGSPTDRTRGSGYVVSAVVGAIAVGLAIALVVVVMRLVSRLRGDDTKAAANPA